MKYTNLIKNTYSKILKPVLFLFDPEFVHNIFTGTGNLLGKNSFSKTLVRKIFRYDNEILEQEVAGIKFKNPIGLSAGFDYDAKLVSILEEIGFGFESTGTVTYSPYQGNPKPRLTRLPKSKSILVNKGFKSNGIVKVLKEIGNWNEQSFNVGISIGATNSSECSTPDAQIIDILKSLKYLKEQEILNKFAYIELNISCPNVLGSGSLAKPEQLTEVLTKMNKLGLNKPLFVKFQLEIEWEKAKELIQIMIDNGVKGIILCNLYKNRDTIQLDSKEKEKVANLKGNFSGKPTYDLSNELISNTYKEFGNKIAIIGVGGIFNAQDAYRKIELGASLVEMITGMIYEGPQVIGEINKGLVEILKSKGYKNISEAIGSTHRN